MTMTEVRPETVAPVTFRRTVLVGIDDPMLEQGLPPVPAPPTAVEQADTDSPFRLVASVASVAFLLLVVGVMAWFRFAGAPHLDGVSGPTPTVTLSVPATPELSDGAAVTVDLGTGAPPEQIDLFVDGDWVGEDHVAPYTPEWEHRSPGEHELKAKVTDVDGRVRYSEPVEVTIKG
jgi:hypothetical protein